MGAMEAGMRQEPDKQKLIQADLASDRSVHQSIQQLELADLDSAILASLQELRPDLGAYLARTTDMATAA